MSKPISVGDLVMVVRHRKCCTKTQIIGLPFLVVAIINNRTPGLCLWCDAAHAGGLLAELEGAPGSGQVELDRLKRIPPLSELEKQKEDLREPA